MNIIVFGKNGQLAKSLRNQTDLNAQFVSSSDVNFLKPREVTNFLEGSDPDLVINCSAYTNVVAAESDENSAHKINVESVERIAKFCAFKDIHLIHISTELVFDGKKKQPYVESDDTNPLNVYGKTKELGEKKVLAHCKKYAILRTSWLYSHYGENFLMKIYKAVLNKDPIFGVSDRHANPTSAFDLARAINQITNQIKNGKDIKGIYHYAGSESTSRFRFIQIICEAMKEKSIINEFSIQESFTNTSSDGVMRPETATFDCSKIKSLVDLDQKTLKNCINEVIDYIK